MQKVKIDKKTLKQNELEIAIQQIITYVKENPKRVIVPFAIAVLVIVITVTTAQYFKKQNQDADIQLLKAQLEYKQIISSTDKSTQIVGLQRSLDAFKKVAQDNSYTKTGKIAGVYIGDCYYHLGRYDDAITAYKDAIQRGTPKLTAAWAQMSIGYSNMNKSDYKTAISEFENLTTQYPESFLVPYAKMQIGICYENLKDVVKARETYERLIKTHPDFTMKNEVQSKLAGLESKPISG